MRYALRVVNKSGEVSTLTLNASSKQTAEDQANQLGFSVLSNTAYPDFTISWFNKKSDFDTLLFSQELVVLLNAGLSLVASIETLFEKTSEPNTKHILERLLLELHQGQTFSNAILAQPKVFPTLFAALVKASERTGDLKHAVERYVIYRTQLEQVRTKLITASIYPVLLLVVGLLVSVFLLGYVVPKFSSIYENVGDNIPLMSRLLMQWGNLLHTHALQVLLIFMVLLVLCFYVLTRQGVKVKISSWLWSIPALGEKLRLYQLARFYRTLGMLLQGGIPLVTALEMASYMLVANLAAQLQFAIQEIKEGKALSFALEQHGLSTAVSKRMIAVGEQAGNMGEMMENTASFYDNEIARWVDWITRVIEPMLMMIIGLMIGGIVVLMYLPIFELADSIQ